LNAVGAYFCLQEQVSYAVMTNRFDPIIDMASTATMRMKAY